MNLFVNADAIPFVRARFDEIAADSSDNLASSAPDDRNLDNTIGLLLPEAIASVHLEAPYHTMEGKDAESPTIIIKGKVAEITLPGALRLVSLKASDSSVTLTSVIPEASPEGRMQLNEYLRGTPDRPGLVLMQDSTKETPHLKYYSTSGTLDQEQKDAATFDIKVFPVPSLTEAEGDGYYFISSKLKNAVLNRLTGMVLEVYGDQRSQSFYQKAALYMK
jgi:hypothetical protein